MSFLIDTNICSAYLKDTRKGAGTAFSRFMQYTGQLHLSTVTLAELYTWALRSKAPPSHLQGLRDLLSTMTLLPVDHDVSHKFGEVQAQLYDQGQPAATADLLIAATALVHGLTLITANTQDFANVPELTMQNWLVP